MSQSNPQKPMFSAPDYRTPNELWLTEPDTLRRLVGVLGMSLPWLLIVFLWWDTSRGAPLESISHYYFTRVSAVFTTTVSLMAIFLLIYKGQSPKEFWLSTAAGIGALLLVLFPTDNIVDDICIGVGNCCGDVCQAAERQYTAGVLRNSIFRKDFHYIASGVFLLCLALMAFLVFAYSKKEIAAATDAAAIRRMKQRNFIYRLCGVLMVLAVAFVLWGDKIVGDTIYKDYHLTFWMETLAVEAFGFSWLLRGDMLLPDKG
jgi:hypothetical protein